MTITQRNSPNRNTGRQGQIPDFIVLHTTGASFQSAVNTILNQNSNVSYHFVISRNGEIIQAVDIKNTAWANGTSNTAGNNQNNQLSTIPAIRNRRINANLYTISIGFGDMPSGNPSNKQLETAVELIMHIRSEVVRIFGEKAEIPVSRSNIIGHHEITPRTRAGCPGVSFPWERLINMLRQAETGMQKPQVQTPQSPQNPQTPQEPQSPELQAPQESLETQKPKPGETLHFPISPQNIKRMVELGVISSPEFWQNVTGIQWLDELMANAGKPGKLDRRIDNGITLADFETALKILVDAKIINSPDYWRNAVKAKTKSKEIQYLDRLIVNMANRALNPLHRIVWAEARGEDLKGQILVANVVINRHKSQKFANGIYNVIFQPNQFTPTRNGAYEKAVPDEMNRQAVDKALGGADYSQGALYFRMIAGAEGGWHEGNLREVFDYGVHRFYV